MFVSCWGQTGDVYWWTRQHKDSISNCDWSLLGSAATHRKLRVDSEAMIGLRTAAVANFRPLQGHCRHLCIVDLLI